VHAKSQTVPPYKSPLPCVSCAYEDKPICAQASKGGDPQTFQSLCLMQSMDCGYYEPRNIF